MVKIVNTAGDIKTGVQGRAVYQRKYGQQIRRTREPKRAIPSETQIRHRQLYKDALLWRKSLSLANRRFLEGYAIANWIVDDHHIPLPWHRLALKLYLEHVHFNILTKPIAPAPGPWQKFEHYETGGSQDMTLWYEFRFGQTFTPQEAHTLDRIDLQLIRKGTGDGPAHLVLKLADVNHKPTGPPLFDVSFPCGEIPLTPPTWWPITCPPTPVAQGIEYALYLHMETEQTVNYICVRNDHQGATYPRGRYILSQDLELSWTTNADADLLFKEYGTLTGTPGQPGELEIRHPALKTITRKHEGVVIPQFDTMSDLDTERLTNILKLPAESGDEILITTVCGLTTKYQV